MSAIIPSLAEMGIAPPPATATVPVDMLPIVDPSHCVPQEVTLLINEKTKSYSGDTFTVIDCKDGKMKYCMKGAVASWSQRKVLLDENERPIMSLKRKYFVMRPSLLLARGEDPHQDNMHVARIERKNLALTPKILVFRESGAVSKQFEFECRGNWRAKEFTVYQKLAGSQERVVAELYKQSRFQDSTSFMKAMMERQSYFVTIKPGMDEAFVVGLVVAIDELFHDGMK